MSNTPRRDAIKERIPEPRAIEDMIALAGDLERELEEVCKQRNELVRASQIAIHVMNMNNWHWASDASNSMKRGAVAGLCTALKEIKQ